MKRAFVMLAVSGFVCSFVTIPGHAKGGSTEDRFLMKAIEMNQAEVELGRLAQTKAQDQRVKDYAEKLVQDHTQAVDRLRRAATGGIGAENQRGKSTNQTGQHAEAGLSPEHQRELDKLSKLSGADFDRAFLNVMAQDQRREISLFEREAGVSTSNQGQTSQRQKPGANSKSADQPDTAAMAREMLPTLREHLEQAQTLQKDLQPTRKP